MAFEGFELSQIAVPDPAGEVSLRVRHGGSGPPLLLLHGYPETHMMWAKVAQGLADRFTVVCPDLRGYGGSTKPRSSHDNETSSKRAMARDAVNLMVHLGFDRFAVAGHDRGGRVAYRLALDHPAAVAKVSILDIIPTGEVWARADRRFALAYWHWSFLAQPHPMPETLIGADPEYALFRAQFGGAISGFDPEAYADYLAAARSPSVIHGMCEDYRAGAGYDRALDEADKKAGKKIACPVQVLWGAKAALVAWYDTLAIWREWADDVQGQAIDCGHFIPEEKPEETLSLLSGFFADSR
ncbi:MAG: alpha/beta hydrolase [Phenylobacterium sp.]|uniref:alpha/beta fold hydrolase n=1 Tax=Phenylobacterium sp. TaxID=1871053 RepID=UPI00120361D7|nr:alpha/beta hydrolase [Phenylobacterium sp.]TAL29866.1 MAG: alpha/beta hydrolase [Phenylobacterium sp.]